MFKLSPFNVDEKIKDNERVVGSISDFWGWAYSALYVPFNRGFFAEYIVFKSLKDGSDEKIRLPLNYLSTKLEKDEPDLIIYRDDNKMTVQVKSLDSVTRGSSFKIKKTKKYNPITDKNDGEKKHCSDLFVFCYLNLDKKQHNELNNLRKNGCKTKLEEEKYFTIQESLNQSVLNMENWIFYLCPSIVVENKESIKLSELNEYVDAVGGKVRKCSYSKLHMYVKEYHNLKFVTEIRSNLAMVRKM